MVATASLVLSQSDYDNCIPLRNRAAAHHRPNIIVRTRQYGSCVHHALTFVIFI